MLSNTSHIQINRPEKLTLNTLAFDFPEKPITFYFTRTDRTDMNLTRLTVGQRPCNLMELYPDIKPNELIYTTFDRHKDGLDTLEIDFTKLENFPIYKAYLNKFIVRYFRDLNYITDQTFIGDTQIWRSIDLISVKNPIPDCKYYDRYTIKVNFNEIIGKPELVISYDRQGKILKKSVKEFIRLCNNSQDVVSTNPQNTNSLLNRVLIITKKSKKIEYRIRRFEKVKEKISSGKAVDFDSMYPIINQNIANFLGHNEDDETNFERVNRYTKNVSKIRNFVHELLLYENFQRVIPISGKFTEISAGFVSEQSKNMMFARNYISSEPKDGLSVGPYQIPSEPNVQIIYIDYGNDMPNAAKLNYMIRNGYGAYKGLDKFLGLTASNAPFGIKLKDKNIYEEVFEKLNRNIAKLDPDALHLALYMTPIGKYDKTKSNRDIYYKVKELLLEHGIVSQCVETGKMQKILTADAAHGKKNYAYSLLNMSIAINAKLGGRPWRLEVKPRDELIIGIGAFKNLETSTRYIGSAVSFDSTGAFNAFDYFRSDQVAELASMIHDAVYKFKNALDNPKRLIIHYYKEMNEKESLAIENTLNTLGLNIPIYVVSINKTESEDIFAFDPTSKQYMPYSGCYVNLGKGKFLLFNNTRYIGDNAKTYPFPIKLKIKSPNAQNTLAVQLINMLIEQVYQFSRLYWKSSDPQSLPVIILSEN